MTNQVGIEIKGYTFYPNARIKFAPSRYLSDKVIDKLKKEFSKYINDTNAYEKKLNYLFTLTENIDLATIVLHNLIDEHINPTQTRRLAFSLTPNNSDENRIYNKVVKELLEKENKSIAWYNTIDDHKTRFQNSIQNGFQTTEELISEELLKIDDHFPKSQRVLSKDNFSLRFEYDDPLKLVSPIVEYEKKLISDIYTYLLKGGEIYTGQFINWWHHIYILNSIEIIKYRKFLIGEQKIHLKIPVIPSAPIINVNQYTNELDDKIGGIVEKAINKNNQLITKIKKAGSKGYKSKNKETTRQITSELDHLEPEESGVALMTKTIEPLIKIIRYKINDRDIPKFRTLLEGKKINGKVLIHAGAKQIADIFAQLNYFNVIKANNAVAIDNWICEYFKYFSKGKEMDMKSHYGLIRHHCKPPIVGSKNKPDPKICKNRLIEIEKITDNGEIMLINALKSG